MGKQVFMLIATCSLSMEKKITKNEFIHLMQVRQNLLLSVNTLFVTYQTRLFGI